MTDQQHPANRLAHESSPYLRQHAHNPVAWYPWGPEALARARQEDRPIFLSIGYSACHWCHVMAHESFADEDTAAFLNEHFVNVKVDREERPDVDQIYMQAVTALTGHGGWPMSVFLTPDLQPFHAGTYYPPEPRYGMPSFRQILRAVADAWVNRREDVGRTAGELTRHLREAAKVAPAEGQPGAELIANAVTYLTRAFDSAHGGFGRAPKFPHPLELKLLLRAWSRTQDAELPQIVRLTLDKMAMGGMYDQLGGGFARYSTDNRWLVPHFEKMAYDNALLAQVYMEAYQATGEPFYREVVEETLGWVARDLTSPEGAFFSAYDADSEGVEGKYYVWSLAEVREVLGPELADLFADVYDVTAEGNWEGHNILNRPKTYNQLARLRKTDEADLRARLAEAKKKLLAVRYQRVPPGRDDKILTAWNGLMIEAFAQAGTVLGPEYTARAARAADFVLTNMRTPAGRLLRTCSPGHPAKLNAYLEDYAFLMDALVWLYEATFADRWLKEAAALAAVAIDLFWDEAEGGFFFVGRDHEELLVRGKEPHDGATPSGNSVAALALLRLAKLTGQTDLEAKAARTLAAFHGLMQESPAGAGMLLTALDFHLGPVEEVAVVGAGAPAAEALRLVQGPFRPRQVVAFHDTAMAEAPAVPLLEGKTAPPGEVVTYVCQNFACGAPLAGVAALREWLKEQGVLASPGTRA